MYHASGLWQGRGRNRVVLTLGQLCLTICARRPVAAAAGSALFATIFGNMTVRQPPVAQRLLSPRSTRAAG